MVLPETRLDLSGIGARRALALGLLVAGSVLGGRATLEGQVRPPGPGPHDPSVPQVAEVRGFATGTGFTPSAAVAEALGRIAAVSPRVLLQRYGRTVEGRPLLLAWISSPENLARLAELKAANVRLFRAGGDAAVEADHPLFIWFAFGVHGDEPAGTEAALELVYHLAATRDPATTAWLERVVVVVDPLLNPDGHARHLRWYRSVAGPEPDPRARAAEHRPGWPTGRTNGLHFDLNRDWAWGVMPETRARWKAYLATLPQVFVDFHEMDPSSSYFFFPPADPVHPLLPASTLAWARVFGEQNARAFTRRGWAWYTGRDFDLVYPGYGDAWSSFHGATGMTYEQAGGGTAGLALATKDGVLSLTERVEHHLGAALATLEGAAARSHERLADFARFWERGTVPSDIPAFYLVPPAAGTEALARRLVDQGVDVETTSAPVDPDRVAPLVPGGRAPASPLPEGTLSVATDQPLGRYAAALLDPRPAVRAATSDISAWSLPLLFDAAIFASRPGLDPPRVAWRPRPRTPATPGPPEPMAEPTVLVWSYGSVSDVLAAIALAARGENVFLAERPLVLDGRTHPRGTFVVPVHRHGEGRVARLRAELTRLGVEPRSVRRIPGTADLGPVRVPRVALLGDRPVLETSLGAVRYLLARAGVAADEVRLEDLRGAALEAYDVVVLPDGADFVGYARRLGSRIGDLEEWVAAGGTLVAVRGGAAALSPGGGGGLEPVAASGSRAGAGGRGRAADPMQEGAPGILMPVRVDASEVLGHGFADGQATVMAWDPVLLEDSEGDVAWRFDEVPSPDRLRPAAMAGLAGRPYALVRALGAGRVVLFADDPGFRGMLPALSKLYLNALVLLPGRLPDRGAAAHPTASGP